MHKKLRISLLSVFLCLTLFISPSYALSPDDLTFRLTEGPRLTSAPLKSVAETTSYVFQLTEDIEIDAEAVNKDLYLYRTEDLSLIESLSSQGLIDHYYEDGKLTLDGLSEDIEKLKTEDYRDAMLGYDYIKTSDASGAGITIGVIDSGLWSGFTEHTNATILEGTNFLVDAESEDRHNTEDNYGHGTFVTSIICSSEAGIAEGVNIVPLKITNNKSVKLSHMLEALYSAVNEYQCDIINISAGGTVNNADFENAIEYAISQGAIVVASSGNLGESETSDGNDALRYPASYDGVIGVGAVDSTKTVWSKSVQNEAVDFVAPGVAANGLSMLTGELITNNGTSFSAPVVTGTIAMALSLDSELTLATLTDLMIETAEDLGAEGRDNSYGYGLINPALLLATIANDTDNLILSTWDDNVGISAYTVATDTNILAFYDDNSKMTETIWNPKLNSYVLPDDAATLCLFSLEPESFVPTLRKRYY